MKEDLDAGGVSQNLRAEPGGLWNSQVASVFSAALPRNLSTTSTAGLTELGEDALLDAVALADAAVAAAGPDLAAQRSALRAVISSKEMRDIKKQYRSKVQAAVDDQNDTIASINTLIDARDFGEAAKAITEARGRIISADTALAFRDRLEKARERHGELLSNGVVAREERRNLQASIVEHLRTKGLSEEEAYAQAKPFLDRFDEQYNAEGSDFSKTVPAEELAPGLRRIGAKIGADLLKEVRPEPPTLDIAEGVSADQFLAGTLARRDAALDVYSGLTGRSAYFADLQRGLSIDPKTYVRVEDIGTSSLFSSMESRRYSILEEWDRAVFSQTPEKRGQAFAATHGQYAIPYQQVLAGKATLESTTSASKWEATFPEVSKWRLTGRATRDPKSGLELFSPSAQKDIEAYFRGKGLKAVLTPATAVSGATKDFDAAKVKGLILSVQTPVDLSGVALSPYVTRYFEDIKTFDKLDEATKVQLLGRFGFPTDPENLEASIQRFRGDQIRTINDWKGRE